MKNRMRLGTIMLLFMFLSGCASSSLISSVTSGSSDLLAMVISKAFAPELRPMEPDYKGFSEDLAEELVYNCKNNTCRHTNFGWASEEARANFVAECKHSENGMMGCTHYKQVYGDPKVYPAGTSAFIFRSGKYKLLAFELRGDGETDSVTLALRYDSAHYQGLSYQNAEGTTLTLVPLDQFVTEEQLARKWMRSEPLSREGGEGIVRDADLIRQKGGQKPKQKI